MAKNELTHGQKLVGKTFKLSNNPDVDNAKHLSAELIDLVNDTHNCKTDEGRAMASMYRVTLKTLAIQKVIEAQMAVVKYITWED